MSQYDDYSIIEEDYVPPIKRRIEDWKSRLIDLSRRNNLLHFKDRKRGTLTISSPSMEKIFGRLVLRKRKLEFFMSSPETSENHECLKANNELRDDFETKHPSGNQLVCKSTSRIDIEKTLKALHRRSLSDYRERGMRTLNAAFGMLVWKKEATAEEIRSPLLFVPIELAKESSRKPFQISVPTIEEEVVLNPALQVKLKNDFQTELPPLPDFWDYQSLSSYLDDVKQVAYKFGWRVESTVEIGLFSFYKMVIYNDLDANGDLILQHPIIRAIAGVNGTKISDGSLPDETALDIIQPPELTFQVLDADSSQRLCIEYALRGQSFVMQGPPGTGKSQTIANIIAECIAHGKSVLFVSDKMAALEVVFKRLREVGLSSFCLELHSSKANKQEVVAELKRCLDETLVPRKLPSEIEFEKMKATINNLNAYVHSLHLRRPFLQKSAYEILGELATLECVPSIPVNLSNPGSLTPQRIYELECLMHRLENAWQVMDDEFPWHGYRENTYNAAVRSELLTFLGKSISNIEAFRVEADKFANKLGLQKPLSFDQVKWLVALGNFLSENPKPEKNWVNHANLSQLVCEAETQQTKFEWLKATRSRLLESYTEDLFNLSLHTSEEIEATLSAISKLLLHLTLDESDLLEKHQTLLDFVKDTQVLSEKWQEKTSELEKIFCALSGDKTPEHVRQLFRVALICFSKEKPEPRWLDLPYFQRVKETFSKMKGTYQEFRSLKPKLEKTYTAKIFEIDLNEYIKRYSSLYTSVLRWFRPSYYRDQKQIASLTHDGHAPQNVLQDLRDARKLKTLQAEIEAVAGDFRDMLGHFYQGYETDLDETEKAIANTSELIAFFGETGLPDKVIQLVSHGSNPPIVIKQIGNELRDSYKKWRELTDDLCALLPLSRLPNSSLPLNETPLAMLKEWSAQLENPLASLHEMTKEILKTNKSEKPKNFKQLISDLKDAENVRKKEAEIVEKTEILQGNFGSRFQGLETRWDHILSVLDWTRQLQALFGLCPIPGLFAVVVSQGAKAAPSNDEIIRLRNETLKTLESLESRFETELTYQNQRLQELNLEDAQNKLEWFKERVDDLQIWVDFKELKHLFSLRGFSDFFNALTKSNPPSSQLTDILHKGIYQEWIDQLYKEDPTLGEFRKEKHEQLINEFKELDQELIRLSPNRVIEKANSRKPQDILIQANDSEVNTLLREAAKKRRLMPIRNLLQRIPHLLFRLKPCLLMSPMSVSQFLPPELMKFDVIVFDEASQIVPEDAIGTIYRGKTIIVAGDNKQLPPTSFFQKSLLENIDWDEIGDEDVEVFDSILDECAGIGLPVKTLRWHYRSKHEELIVFSNHTFYNDTLITFPSAIAKDETLGLKLVHVPDGVYDRGGRRDNPREAEVVANLVFEHFAKYPNKTLGVVTFSIAQMDAVEEAIDRNRRQQPEWEHFFKEDRLEGFFVKNLENVQGDERDVIILSLGYGYDANGNITMNFGPVNKAGGERRLNVAVTRARERTILVTSIKASDIDLESARSEGTKILHDYLEYGEKGPAILRTVNLGKDEYLSPTEKTVAAVLNDLGYTVVSQVGCSLCPINMGVVDPHNSGSYLSGIEFDGSTYQKSSSARDRDRLREQVLKMLGWRIYRVWSPTWVARRESEVRKLSSFLKEINEPKLEKEISSKVIGLDEAENDDNNFSEKVDIRKVQFGSIEKIWTPYKVHKLGEAFNPALEEISFRNKIRAKDNTFCFPENRSLQSRLLEKLIQEEGPIHFDYAVRRLASAWKLRKTPKIVQTVKEALNLLLVSRKVIVKGSFLWPQGLQDVIVRIPVPGIPQSKRKPQHIPPEEIETAMKTITHYALSISSESLITETAKVFGFNRLGEKTKKRFADVYKRLLWKKELACNNGIVTLT
jgi:hypothetical protein